MNTPRWSFALVGLVLLGCTGVLDSFTVDDPAPEDVTETTTMRAETPAVPEKPVAGASEAGALTTLAEVGTRHALEVIAIDIVNPDPAGPSPRDTSAGVVSFRLPDPKAVRRFLRFVPAHPGSECCGELGPETAVLAGELCALERAREWSVTWADSIELNNGEKTAQGVLFMTLHCEAKSPLGFQLGDDLSLPIRSGCFAARPSGQPDHLRSDTH